MMKEDAESRPVSINPDVMSGSLVVSGTRIPVSILMGMKLSGKADSQIADRYRLTAEEVEQALIHLEKPVQKVA